MEGLEQGVVRARSGSSVKLLLIGIGVGVLCLFALPVSSVSAYTSTYYFSEDYPELNSAQIGVNNGGDWEYYTTAGVDGWVAGNWPSSYTYFGMATHYPGGANTTAAGKTGVTAASDTATNETSHTDGKDSITVTATLGAGGGHFLGSVLILDLPGTILDVYSDVYADVSIQVEVSASHTVTPVPELPGGIGIPAVLLGGGLLLWRRLKFQPT